MSMILFIKLFQTKDFIVLFQNSNPQCVLNLNHLHYLRYISDKIAEVHYYLGQV